MITGKLPLDLENRRISSLSNESEVLSVLVQGPEIALSSTIRKSKAIDCISQRPVKKARIQQDTHDKIKKCVRFVADETKLFEIIPRKQGEEYQCHSRWYTRWEYNVFRQDIKMNFFMHSLWMKNAEQHAHQGNVPPPADMCVRGLEKFCFYSNQAVVKDMRRLRMQAVLDQQRIQGAFRGPFFILRWRFEDGFSQVA